MRRAGFIFGILLTIAVFMTMGQTYITHVGQDWLIEGATLKNCNIMGSIGPSAGLGTIYYVDNNAGSDAENGLSWTTAVKTLAKGMELSHAKISSGGHATDRNIIYYTADQETADLTTLAQKTDIIGVGSDAWRKGATLIGHHVIPAAATANYQGCRFFNIAFYDDDAGGILWDVDGQIGIEFNNCEIAFKATDTIGIRLDECPVFILDNCYFSSEGVGNAMGFTTAAIQITDGTISSYASQIKNCRIQAGGIGIDWDETASYASIIKDNDIYATGLPIDCEDDNVVVLRNMMNTAVDCDTYAIGTGFDFALKVAANNVLMGSGAGAVANWVPPHE